MKNSSNAVDMTGQESMVSVNKPKNRLYICQEVLNTLTQPGPISRHIDVFLCLCVGKGPEYDTLTGNKAGAAEISTIDFPTSFNTQYIIGGTNMHPPTVSTTYNVQATPPYEQFTVDLLAALTDLYIFDRETFYDLVSIAIFNAGELCREEEGE